MSSKEKEKDSSHPINRQTTTPTTTTTTSTPQTVTTPTSANATPGTTTTTTTTSTATKTPATSTETQQQATTSLTSNQPSQGIAPQQPTANEGISLCDLLTGIENTVLAYDTLTLGLTPDCEEPEEKEVTSKTQLNPPDIENLSKSVEDTANLLKNINDVRTQLGLLNLDTFEKDFFDNKVNPFLNILVGLASASGNLATSANVLNTINADSKKDVEDTLELMVKLNEKSEDVYKVLRKRINTLLKIGRIENKTSFFRSL